MRQAQDVKASLKHAQKARRAAQGQAAATVLQAALRRRISLVTHVQTLRDQRSSFLHAYSVVEAALQMKVANTLYLQRLVASQCLAAACRGHMARRKYEHQLQVVVLEQALRHVRERESALAERLQTQSAAVLQAAVSRTVGQCVYTGCVGGGDQLVAVLQAKRARRELVQAATAAQALQIVSRRSLCQRRCIALLRDQALWHISAFIKGSIARRELAQAAAAAQSLQVASRRSLCQRRCTEEMLQMLHEEARLRLQEMELDERLQTQSAGVLQAAVCRVLGRLEHSKKLEGGYRLVAAMRAADARREHMAGLLFGSCLCSDDGMTQMRCWLIPLDTECIVRDGTDTLFKHIVRYFLACTYRIYVLYTP